MSIFLRRFRFFLEIMSKNCLISHLENLITVVETAWDTVEKLGKLSLEDELLLTLCKFRHG